MIILSPPQYITDILGKLEEHGHQAYLVGGCVRDLLLDRFPHDWDICTAALPEEMLAIFPDAIPTGLQHGTVTVRGREKHELAEVTTFRAESAYSDHRRPDSVAFIRDLDGDLSRRDFTMNAIALDKDGNLIDPFDGQADIRRRCIRCVREPDARFQEDALRMFRALRFSAVLGFSIEPETFAAIGRHAHLSAFLAAERIREELEKTLCSARPALLTDFFRFGLLDHLILTPSPRTDLSSLTRLPPERLLRWSGLCALLQKSGCIATAEAFLTALRLDGNTIRACSAGLIARQSMPLATELDCKRLLAAVGQDSALSAAAADIVLGCGAENPLERIRQILAGGDCISLKTLAVTGHDLAALGLRGREIGTMLARLLDYVLAYPSENKHATLLTHAQQLQKEDAVPW